MSLIEICENHEGFKRSVYYFVVDEDRLIHISKYAVSYITSNKIQEYKIDVSRVRGNKIIKVWCSNKRYVNLSIYPSLESVVDTNKVSSAGKEIPLSHLNSYKLTWLSAQEYDFINNEWSKYYKPMLHRLKVLSEEMSQRGFSVRFPMLINYQIKEEVNFPLSYLLPYSEKARDRSLKVLTRLIHQCWLLAHMVNELEKSWKQIEYSFGFMQSPSYPIAIFEKNNVMLSIWYEFDTQLHTMCHGIMWENWPNNYKGPIKDFLDRAYDIFERKGLKNVPLRPDIVILKDVKDCDDLINKGIKAKAIIECKNDKITNNDINKQIIPYKEIFQPELMIVASLKQVPSSIKEMLNKQGITIIDSVYPNGSGELELMNVLKKL